jgi:hypothetical protein
MSLSLKTVGVGCGLGMKNMPIDTAATKTAQATSLVLRLNGGTVSLFPAATIRFCSESHQNAATAIRQRRMNCGKARKKTADAMALPLPRRTKSGFEYSENAEVIGPTRAMPRETIVTACKSMSSCSKVVLFIASAILPEMGRTPAVSKMKILPLTQHPGAELPWNL